MGWEILLNVLAVIGVIAASVVVIYFIAKLVIISTDKNKTKVEFVEEKGETKTLEDEKRLEEKPLVEEKEQQVEEVKAWDDAQAEKEKGAIAEGDVVSSLVFEDEQNPSRFEQDFDAMDEVFNDDEEIDYGVTDEEAQRLIEKINTESLAEYNELQRVREEGLNSSVETKEEQKDMVQEVFGIEEDDDEEAEEGQEQEVVEEQSYEDEKSDLDKERREIEEAQAQIEAERADLEQQKKQLEAELKRLEELKAEQANAVIVSDVSSLYSDETLEQLEKRLEVLNERLKENKKDLRENKKEYNPLAKVKKTLEKDKAKLTRKEAIVARQKVILYGVNNYVDIDEEKAKKLNEELDLLDGLRLSVQHCEDVMNANKDRFPILEKTNRILKKVNAEILSDIAEVEKAIEEKKKQVA